MKSLAYSRSSCDFNFDNNMSSEEEEMAQEEEESGSESSGSNSEDEEEDGMDGEEEDHKFQAGGEGDKRKAYQGFQWHP